MTRVPVSNLQGYIEQIDNLMLAIAFLGWVSKVRPSGINKIISMNTRLKWTRQMDFNSCPRPVVETQLYKWSVLESIVWRFLPKGLTKLLGNIFAVYSSLSAK